MRATRRGLLAGLALLAVTTACGPRERVSLGVRDVITDVLLSSARPTPSAGPAAPLPPGFPFVPVDVSPGGDGSVSLPPLPSESPLPAPQSCPPARPLASPAHAAPNRPDVAPRPGSYPTRVDGSYRLTGSIAASGVYGPSGVRVVRNVAPLSQGAGWSYDIADERGLTTSYEVIPAALGPDNVPVDSANQPVPTQPGIYITGFSYERADRTALTLAPQPPLMVAKLPFTAADKWTSHSTDAAKGVSIVLNGQTGLGTRFDPVKARVDACGTLLDAWWVEYTVDTTPVAPQVPAGTEPPSQITGADLAVRFVGSRVAFGSEYGGIPLEELYVLAGTDAGTTVAIRRHAVTSVEPALVGSRVG